MQICFISRAWCLVLTLVALPAALAPAQRLGGFTSRASGDFDNHLKAQIDSDVARLLSANVQATSSSN